MRKNLGKDTVLYPMPVLIIGSYDENGNPDAMNAAWGGIHDYNEVFMCLSAGHKTVKNILKTGAFTVSVADEAHIVESDYFGIVSGNDTLDKIAKAGMTTEKSEFVNAPIIIEYPLTLECTLKSYDAESGSMVGEIVNISVDEKILTDGKIDGDKLRPISFDPSLNAYRVVGGIVGSAFADGKKLK